jgi:hypothetical protein
MIETLRTEKVIDVVTAGRWQAARRTRNKAIYGEAVPNTAEVMRLLELLAP